MATSTNLEQDMTRALDKAAQCRWIGDYDGAIYWEHEAQNYSDRIVLMQSRDKWQSLADNRHG